MSDPNVVYVPVRQLDATWHELRKGRITASIAAACLGRNPWSNPRKAWRIINELEENPSNWFMEHGREFEAAAVSLYEQHTGNLCRQCGFYYRSDLPWLGASPDRTVGTDGLLEVKCSGNDHDECEPYWKIQAQVQLACTGRDWCDVCWYRDGQIRVWRIDRTGVDDLVKELEQWHKNHVLTGLCPAKRRRESCSLNTKLPIK